MNIYLAGKITKNGWRETIVDGLRDALYLSHLEDVLSDGVFPILTNSIFGQHDYIGPFFVGCDHGCLHSPESHGWGLGDNIECCGAPQLDVEYQHSIGEILNLKGKEILIGNELGARTWLERRVAGMCLEAINRADIVFAWLDSNDLYGTIAEIGYAYALNKTILAAYPMREFNPREIWFPFSLADDYIHIYDNPRAALEILIREHELREFQRTHIKAIVADIDSTIPNQTEDFRKGMEYARWLICEAPFETLRPEGYEKRFPSKTIRQAWAAGRLSKEK